ncbi:DUF5304 family protein [Embleya sp. AB8]|uniref:DUF5304 family protein n=1 Tax=Embleya sp. AB8 TaxID=3156304 RepID=UPI003C763DF2
MDPDERDSGKGSDAWAAGADEVPTAGTGTEGERTERGDPWGRLGDEARRLAESLTGADRGDDAPAARLAEEARRLAEALVEQAGAVREQMVRRHPEVAAHLAAAGSEFAAAGSELAAAFRAFVGDRERRWAAKPAETERIRLDDE